MANLPSLALKQIYLTTFLRKKGQAIGFFSTSKIYFQHLEKNLYQSLMPRIWQMLADEIDGTNQLLETCKIYL